MLTGAEKAVTRGEAGERRAFALDELTCAGLREMSKVALRIEAAALFRARRQRRGVHGCALMVRKGMVRSHHAVSCIDRDEAHINRTWGGRTRRWLFE